MSMTELQVFQAELDRLEREDRWDAPEYDYLAAKVEELQAASKSKPSAAQAPATTGQPEPDLAARMLAMQANPERYSDEQVQAVVREYNAAVLATGQTDQPERIDVAALARRMAAAAADPNLDPEQAQELGRRYNAAIRQGDQHTTAELRAELSSPELGMRMLAAAALLDRGEQLPDELVSRLTGEDFMAWQQQRLEAERDPANLPPEIQEAGKVLYQAEAAMGRPADPIDAALGDLRAYVGSMRPPSLEQQLAALGVEPDPDLGVQAESEPAQVSDGQ